MEVGFCEDLPWVRQSAARGRTRTASEVAHHARPLAARWRGRNERGERGRNESMGISEGTSRRDFSKGLSEGTSRRDFSKVLQSFQIEGTSRFELSSNEHYNGDACTLAATCGDRCAAYGNHEEQAALREALQRGHGDDSW